MGKNKHRHDKIKHRLIHRCSQCPDWALYTITMTWNNGVQKINGRTHVYIGPEEHRNDAITHLEWWLDLNVPRNECNYCHKSFALLFKEFRARTEKEKQRREMK